MRRGRSGLDRPRRIMGFRLLVCGGRLILHPRPVFRPFRRVPPERRQRGAPPQ